MRACQGIRRLLLTLVLVAAASSATAEESDTPALQRAASDDAPPSNESRPAHPEPRVIVNVMSVHGPHRRAEVERSARLAWGKIVRCHKTIDQRARGAVTIELVIASSGKVTGARRITSTLKNRELTSCLTSAIKGVAMPKAKARSTAHAEVHVAPGDPS
jgi:hypothetical protein